MRFVKVNEEGIVFQIRYGKEKLEHELLSDVAKIGDRLNEDGTFSHVEKEETNDVDIYQKLLLENQYQTALIENILFGG